MAFGKSCANSFCKRVSINNISRICLYFMFLCKFEFPDKVGREFKG